MKPAPRTELAGQHRARKRFGQHFLTDSAVIEAIVTAINPQPGQTLVEIGPGLGALTRPLLSAARALTVIELDRDLARHWRAVAGVRVIEADVLRVDVAALADPAPGANAPTGLRLVGNLPYNISSPILFHLLEVASLVRDQHFMLQKEVVDRMLAPPGGADYSRLSVMLQWRYAMQRVLDVGPGCFDPPPRVDSAVVRMTPLAQPAALDAAVLSELVQVAFSQRRKLLRHTLGVWMAQRELAVAFDLQRRAQEVPVCEYVTLAQAAQQARG